MASLANKDEAEKCRDMAKNFLSKGEHEKAVRFAEKSLRLYPLGGVEAMRDLAKVGARYLSRGFMIGPLLSDHGEEQRSSRPSPGTR